MRSNQNPSYPTQSGSGPNPIPYFPPVPEIRQPTAEEMIKKVVADVKAEKEKEKESKIEFSAYNLPKCDLHPKKLSNNCRKCKKIKEQMDEIEKKKLQEKEKQNPENRLREIFNEGAAGGQSEDVKHKKNPNAPMPVWGDASTFNMNELLRNNIKTSPYFNELFAMRTIPEVIDEIIKKATHAEPWVSGHQGIPSTFFCCLLRLMMMRLSENQVRELTDYKGSALVRCAGFLYLRYCCNPENLWDWFGKYMLDEEEVHPAADANVVMSVGEYAENLLTDMNYHNTIFPRIPLVIDREIKKNILMMRDRRLRKRKNIDQFDEFVKGAKVMAISPEDNDWHEATLVRIEGWHMRVKFTNVKEQNDDADFTLELLEKKFQGEDVFMGGDEVLVDLGEIMTPSDTIDHLKSVGELAEAMKGEQKIEKMEEEPKRIEKTSEDRERTTKDSRKKKGRSASSSSSSSSSSSDESDRDRRKRKHGKRRDGKGRRRRSRSSSAGSSSDSSRSRSRDRKKKERRRKEKSRERRREKDRVKEKPRKEESAERSPARSDDSPKRRKAEVKPKEKTDKYMERVLQMQAEGASARSKAEYAARPVSYKTSLSANVPGGDRRKQGRSRSPNKKVVVVKQEGYRRNEDEEVEAPKQKQQPTAEALERMRKLKEQYGDISSKNSGGTSKKNRDLDEGPDVLKLGS